MTTGFATAAPLRDAHLAVRPRTVLVVDDDARAFDDIQRVVHSLGARMKAARSVEAAVGLAQNDPPALLLTTLDLGGSQRGLQLARILRQRWGTAVVFVGAHLAPEHSGAVAAFDPDAFLCKPLRREQLDATLRLVLKRVSIKPGSAHAGGSPSGVPGTDLERALRQIAAVLRGTGLEEARRDAALGNTELATLRPREQEVVRLLVAHYRVPAIAHQLGISPQTVRNHLKGVFRRLGVHSQQELLERLRAAPSSPAAERPAPSES